MSHRPRFRQFLVVLVAALVVAAGANLAAQAAGGGKGKPVLAGKTTLSSKLTTLKRTKAGPALKLKTKAGSPPLAVTSSERVARLNADQVDGLDADDLATTTYAYQVPGGGTPAATRSVVFPDLPAGSYLVTYAVALQGTGSFTQAQCLLRQDGVARVIGLDYAGLKGGFATASSSGRVDVTAGDVRLICSGSTTFLFDSTDAGASVVFTRTDLVERSATDAPAPRSEASREGAGARTATGR